MNSSRIFYLGTLYRGCRSTQRFRHNSVYLRQLWNVCRELYIIEYYDIRWASGLAKSQKTTLIRVVADPSKGLTEIRTREAPGPLGMLTAERPLKVSMA
jgi:hypothetical protein